MRRAAEGADADPVVETRFYANVADALCGAICFVDGGVADRKMVPVASGERVDVEALGPDWKAITVLQLRSVTTDDEFVFSPTSAGGRQAVAKLLDVYSRRLRGGVDGVMIIELGASSYQHKLYGTVNKPLLKFVGWHDEIVVDDDAVGAGAMLNDAIPF